ncbi:uncharacterized protein JCM10292_007173 [Rhodotorula paludigena]|uniref:uncharacterized protein n=1 Tax=Rhodotorula paludigena TaxID=86838 RepID=UPI00316C1B1C
MLSPIIRSRSWTPLAFGKVLVSARQMLGLSLISSGCAQKQPLFLTPNPPSPVHALLFRTRFRTASSRSDPRLTIRMRYAADPRKRPVAIELSRPEVAILSPLGESALSDALPALTTVAPHLPLDNYSLECSRREGVIDALVVKTDPWAVPVDESVPPRVDSLEQRIEDLATKLGDVQSQLDEANARDVKRQQRLYGWEKADRLVEVFRKLTLLCAFDESPSDFSYDVRNFLLANMKLNELWPDTTVKFLTRLAATNTQGFMTPGKEFIQVEEAVRALGTLLKQPAPTLAIEVAARFALQKQQVARLQSKDAHPPIGLEVIRMETVIRISDAARLHKIATSVAYKLALRSMQLGNVHLTEYEKTEILQTLEQAETPITDHAPDISDDAPLF